MESETHRSILPSYAQACYLWLRRLLRTRRSQFRFYQHRIRQAGMATTYDAYLAKGIIMVGAVLVAGVVGTSLLILQGWPWLGAGVAAGGIALATLVGIGWWVTPSVYRRQRAAEIDVLFPHALVMMYVLARAGMSLTEIIERLGEAEDVYGELGTEFAQVHRDVTYFGADLQTALEDAQSRTPNATLETFFGDLAGLLESGSTLESFVEREHHRQRTEATEAQETFLDRLESFVQIYIITVFVGPVFALILLILISFHGAETTGLLYFLAYVYPLLAIGAALLVLNRIETAISLPPVRPQVDRVTQGDATPDDELFRAYQRAKRRRQLREWNPLETVRRHPWTALVPAIPVALLFGAGGVHLAGGWTAVTGEPVHATAIGTAVLVVALLPVTILLERQRLERRQLIDHLGDVCDRFAEGTAAGMNPQECCAVVAERTAGPARGLIERVHHELSLSGDPARAFRAVAAQAELPEVTLTFAPIAAGYNATAQLEQIFEELGKTATQQAALASKRRRAMELYTLVVVIGLVVFVSVAFFLETFFLPNLELAGEADQAGFIRHPPLDPGEYRVLLYHATLVQAAGNGLFIGKLRDGSLAAGLKYSLLLVGLTTLAFLGMVGF